MVFGTARAVKSHRTGRRRKKGGSRLPVAPWIVITLVCVLVASGLTWGFMTLLRAGCSGDVFRVTVAAAPSVFSSLEDAAQEWESTQPEAASGQCIGVQVAEVPAPDASRGIVSGVWDQKAWGKPPIAWVPDSQAWASSVSSDESSVGRIGSDPIVLGEAGAVLAVPESTATSLGWLGGQPPTWADVLALTADGTLNLAAANPRTSTEGLMSLLNATSDGAGGFSEDAKAAYSAAVEAGTMTEAIGQQFSAHAEAPDPATVFTALDYQVESFNATSGLEDPLVPITPADATVTAVASYMVLGGAWVSESDAGIAERFGEYLASSDFSDADLRPVEDPEAALAQTTPEAVGQALRSWQSDRRDLNVLFLIDRSAAAAEEVVSYGGADLTAADATVSMAVGMVEEMATTYRAGLWEYGVGADGEDNWRAVTDVTEMSDGNRGQLIDDMYTISENEPYEGGSPLYDSLVAAYQYMTEHASEGDLNVVVVLTNSGEDTQSIPTVEETAASLASLAGSVKAYTVGFGAANADNLATLAEATGGAYIQAPAEGGVLADIGG